MMTRKRPPRCPYCRYNLVGTYLAGHRRYEITCSECGETFMSDEVHERYAPGGREWTPILGLQKLIIAATWRIPIVVAIALIEYIALFSWYGGTAGAPFNQRGTLAITIIAGVLLGAAANYKLSDIAGFEGVVVAVISLVSLLTACAITYLLVVNAFPLTRASQLHGIGVLTLAASATLLAMHAFND